MKYLLFISFTILIFDNAHSQIFLKKSELKSVSGYIYGIKASKDQKYYSFSASSWETCLIDTSLNIIKEFKYDALWGGGGPDFSFDSKYLAFVNFGEEKDSICIYNMQNSEIQNIPTNAYNLKFFHKSHKILFTKDGKFNIYDIEKSQMFKNIFNVGSLPNGFSSSFCISSNDSIIYATTVGGLIALYSTDGQRKLTELGPFGNISNLTLLDKSGKIIFSVNDSVLIFDISANKITERMKVDFAIPGLPAMT